MPEIAGGPGEPEELEGRIAEVGDLHESQLEHHEELMPRENRVVIYGTWATGAADLAGDMLRVMQEAGITDPDVSPARRAYDIERAFFYRSPAELQDDKKTLPRGVVMMPMMKYEMVSGSGTDGPTPVAVIQEMCAKYGVPSVLLANYNTPGEAMTRLLAEMSGQPGPREIEGQTD